MKEIYSWVPWFRELAEKISREGEEYLIKKAKQVAWGKSRALVDFGDEAIDPLSFFYFLASKNTINQLKPVYDSVSEVFEINPLDTDLDDVFYYPTPKFKILFHDGKKPNSNLLWRLFRQAMEDKPQIASEVFMEVLNIQNVGVPKLTQTLFLVNPHYFLPVDSSSADMAAALDLPAQSEIKDEGYEKYRSFLRVLKGAFPGCKPYEINMFLYLQNTKELKLSGDFYQVSTHAYGDKRENPDYWESGDEPFKENNWVYVGGQRDRRPYPLTSPKQGDAILVRTGTTRGRAIGIVYKNEYHERGGWERELRIHVLWINKQDNQLPGTTIRDGFTHANSNSSTFKAFRNTESYQPSFDLIGKLKVISNGSEQDAEPATDSQPRTDARKHPLNQILYGPPGTSKTWNTVNHALAIIDNNPVDQLEKESEEVREGKLRRFNELKKNGQFEMVTFHQNYNYEDFIEGIKPVLRKGADDDGNLDYVLSQGVFRRIAESASIDSKRKYVLILDEINRGNIAKIFGELITLIEDSKRKGGDDATTATLPYSKEEFGVPDNLYIIGTMNTADRSIALLDTALRRRFHFVEMMPDSRLVSEDVNGVNLKKLLETINKRIRLLLDREHQIGHTYLMDVKSIDSLASTFKNKIVPLLQEYFYDNWEKIDLVLNRNGLIRKITIESGLFKESDLIDDQSEIYELLPADDDKWHDPGSYRAIYEQAKSGSEQGS